MNNIAVAGPVADDGDSLGQREKEEVFMVNYESRDFIYAKNGDDLKSLKDFVSSKGGYVQSEYIFIDEPDECKEFDKLLDVANEGDRLYVPTIKVFQYGRVSDFIEVLEYFNGWSIKVISMAEPDYKCAPYVTAIDIVRNEIMEVYTNFGIRRKQELEDEIAALETQKENLLRRGGRPQKEIQKIEALALYRTEKFRIDEICSFTGLSKSSLFRALADVEDQQTE